MRFSPRGAQRARARGRSETPFRPPAGNAHDASAVAALFTPTGTLRDWDIEVHGAAAVGEANGKIVRRMRLADTWRNAQYSLRRARLRTRRWRTRRCGARPSVRAATPPFSHPPRGADRTPPPAQFAAVPNIKIEVLHVHVAAATRTATAEIIVHVNNEAKETLKVADVITFAADGKIESVRAYKG